jgi:iron complex outermembrane recepter protein
MKIRSFVTAASLLALMSTPAFAQSEADDSDAAPGEIVVTATRSETLLSKTPVAMTAISGENLTAAGITNPTALAEQVPNLDISRSNGLQITIRGVTSTDGTEKGDPSAAFMIDGVYIARPQVQEVSFFDIARVEVLRGPQGTLYGRNTTAGLVNLITNKPKLGEFSGSVDLGYGNYSSLQGTGVINLPVGEKVAIRAAVNYDRRDSYLIPGPLFTAKADPFKKNLSARLSALFEIGNGELLIRGDYTDLGGITFNAPGITPYFSGFAGVGVNPLYLGASLTSEQLRTINTPNALPLARDNSTWGIMADFSQDFGGISLNYLGSYREFKRGEDNINIRGGGVRTIATRFDGDYWQQSHELRLSTNGDGPLKAQAGAYYFEEQSGIYFYLFGLLNPTPGAPGYVFGFPQNPTKAKSYAGFAQVTYSLADTVRLTAGVRHSKDDKSRVGATVTCSTTACNLPSDVLAPNNAHRKFAKTTWRVGLDADINDRTLAYATVSTGYKAGGFNDGCLSGSAGCPSTISNARTENGLYYDPETLTSYEVGIKTRFLDNAVRLNLSAFHYDYKSLQLSQIIVCTPSGGNCQNTTNAGSAKVDGVEMDATITPSENDRFELAINYLKARYDVFRPATAAVPLGIDFHGKALDRSPSWTASAGYTHTFQLGGGSNIEAGVRTRISDSYMLAGLANLFQFRQPGYSKTDATITFNAPDKRFYVQAFVKNIEDTVLITTAAPGANGTVQLGDPRTFGVRGGFKF